MRVALKSNEVLKAILLALRLHALQSWLFRKLGWEF